jgi:hypothetical protein
VQLEVSGGLLRHVITKRKRAKPTALRERCESVSQRHPTPLESRIGEGVAPNQVAATRPCATATDSGCVFGIFGITGIVATFAPFRTDAVEWPP